MKFVNFQSGNQIRLGIKTDQGIIDVEKAAAACSLEVPITIEEVIEGGEVVLSKLVELTGQAEPTCCGRRTCLRSCGYETRENSLCRSELCRSCKGIKHGYTGISCSF